MFEILLDLLKYNRSILLKYYLSLTHMHGQDEIMCKTDNTKIS